MEQKETFSYTYSAAQQEEIAAIRKKYVQQTETPTVDKMAELRKLDAGVSNKAMTVSVTVGILGALIMGTGMSLIMTDLAAMLGIASALIPGIVIGVIGMTGIIAAFPLHQHILKKERARIAPKILKLTDELSGT